MIHLYSWNTSNGRKISIMLEEIGMEYEWHPINIGKDEQFQPHFLKISPNNRIPAIIDTDGPGGGEFSLFESGAILIYLAEKAGSDLWPSEPRKRYEVLQWLMWQMGGVGPMQGQAHHFRRAAKEEIPYGIKRYTDETHRLYGVMNKQLEGKDFICGDYSIADIAIFPWCRQPERRGVDQDEFPNHKRWVDAVSARPGVKRGVEVLAENTRQGGHSKEGWDIMFGEKQFQQR